MKVMSRELVEGCVTTEDIKGVTKYPIIPKNTVITKKHLEVIRAFLIKEVEIEPLLNNGDMLPMKANQDFDNHFDAPSLFIQYTDAVKSFKEIFKNWQSGVAVDIFKLRKIFVPLVDEFFETSVSILSFQHYVEKKDYLYHHAISVGLIASFLAKKLGYNKGDVTQVGLAGVLADCGMSKVPFTILDKETTLTPKEIDLIKEHTVKGYKMLQKTPAIQEGVLLAVLQHHERQDGTGYPLGVSGDKLHPFSEIVAICDAFHALMSDHVYRSGYSPFTALEILSTEMFGKFNHKMLKVLQDEVVNVSVGMRVKLSNYQIGEIIFVQPSAPTRPMVRYDNGDIVSLKDQPNLSILEIF